MSTTFQGAGYPQPAAPVDRELVGQLTAYEERSNGWVRFSILEQGMQYPVKCDTKKAEIVQAAMALGGQIVVAQIREQQSDAINPHNGKPYTNRYLNEIALAGYPGQPVQPQPGPPPQPQPQGFPQPVHAPAPQFNEVAPGKTGAEKDLDIHRQVAWKGAIMLASTGKIEMTPVALVEAAEVGLAYMEYGPLRFGVTPFNQGQDNGHPFDDALPEGQGAPQFEQGGHCPDCGYPPPEHAYGCPRGNDGGFQ